MHLNCPECRSPILADDVNLVKTIAKCKDCNNIFQFTNELEEAGLPVRYRKEIVIPSGIELLKLMNELEIMIKWRRSSSYFLPFFALFWNGFMLVFSLALIYASAGLANFITIPFWLVGFYLIYASVGYLVNTSYITVDENRLSIEHRPIKFLIQKDQHFHPDDIQQLYVRRYEEGKSNEESVYAYSVEMILKGGKTVKLVKGLHQADYARFIEQEIEQYLNIKDREIQGEWVYD